MPIIWDILILAALVIFTAWGVHRGFILTFCSLLALVVALVGANLAADALAPRLADTLQPRLEESIRESLEEKAQQAGAHNGLSVSDTLAALKEKGGFYQWAAERLEDTLESVTAETTAQVAAAAAAAVAEQVAHSLIFLVAFFLVLILWTLLSRALDLVARLPGLSSLNGFLGGALGFVKGLLIVYLAVWILCDFTGFVSPETVGDTYLLSFLTRHSLWDLLMVV